MIIIIIIVIVITITNSPIHHRHRHHHHQHRHHNICHTVIVSSSSSSIHLVLEDLAELCHLLRGLIALLGPWSEAGQKRKGAGMTFAVSGQAHCVVRFQAAAG